MGKHILARQNGNAIQYVQVTKTGGTKITTDPTNATLFDSVASAERQKNHAPKKLKEYQVYDSGILHAKSCDQIPDLPFCRAKSLVCQNVWLLQEDLEPDAC